MLTLKQTLVESLTNSQAIRFNSIPKSYFPSLNTVPYATEQFDGLFDIFRGKQFLFHFYCFRRYNPILLCAFLTMHRETLKVLSRKRLLPISNSNGNSFHFWSCRKTSASGEVQCFLCAGAGCMTVTEYVGAFELRDQKRLSSHMFKRTGSKKLLKSIITLLSEPSCGTSTTIIQILLSNSQPTLLLTGCVFEIYLLLRLTIKSTHWQSNSFKFQTCTKPRTVITSTRSPVEKGSMLPPWFILCRRPCQYFTDAKSILRITILGSEGPCPPGQKSRQGESVPKGNAYPPRSVHFTMGFPMEARGHSERKIRATPLWEKVLQRVAGSRKLQARAGLSA